MSTYNSEAFRRGVRYRALNDGAFELSASVRIPAGRALAVDNKLNFLKLSPGVDILELALSTSASIFDGAAGTFKLGTDVDDDNFVAASTGFQSGVRNVKFERASFAAVFNPTPQTGNTSITPRAYPLSGTQSHTGAYVLPAPSGAVSIQLMIVNAGTQTNSDDNERIITLTGKFAPLAITTPTLTPYEFKERGAAHGLIS